MIIENSPKEILTGLKAWWDFAKLNTITSSGGVVSQVNDLSGNNNHLVQATVGERPTIALNSQNAKSIINLDEANDEHFDFTSNIADIRTVFWVLKEEATPTGYGFLLGTSPAFNYDFHREQTSGYLIDGVSANAAVINGSWWENLNSSFDPTTNNPSSSYKVYACKTTGNVSANNMAYDRSYGRCWDGSYLEVIISNVAESDANIERCIKHLMNKWSIS